MKIYIRSYRINIKNVCFLFIFSVFSIKTLPIAQAGSVKKRTLEPAQETQLCTAYEAAKAVYLAGRYQEARTLFEQLCTAPGCLPCLTPYIHFYYALATYQSGMLSSAADIFASMRVQFPKWDKQHELHYWYAQCAFQQGNFKEALTSLSLIKHKDMADVVADMKRYFLKQLDNNNTLEALMETFPDDLIIQEILYKKVARQSYATRDNRLFNKLKNQYNFKQVHGDPLRRLQSKHKERYKVAVLLPFFVDEIDFEACESQFVLELYQGIQIAVKTLKEEGIHIDLFAFDTKNSAAVTETILKQEGFTHMDLIIGPLYPASIPLVSAFSEKYKINFVNPISSNASIVDDHPFAFLFQPSLERYAEKAADLTLSHIDRFPEESPYIALFYSDAKEDVMQATWYRQIIEQKLGKEINICVQLQNNQIKDFFSYCFKKAVEADKPDKTGGVQDEAMETLLQMIDGADLTKITHIYIASKNKLLVSNIIGLALKLNIKPQVIGYEEWIKLEILPVHHLKRIPILFLAPRYIDFNRPEVKHFRKKFYDQTATHPDEQNYMGYIGYEMMILFGNMLAKYGTYFQKAWENMHYDGRLFQGAFYGTSQSNQHMPTLRFVHKKFVVDAYKAK